MWLNQATNYTAARLGCSEGEYNDLATLLWAPREHVILHVMDRPERIGSPQLVLAGAVFGLLMALAYGAAYPAGVFIPTITAGACLGGAFGNLLVLLQDSLADAGVPVLPVAAAPYALIGAVAMLGGMLRSSLSLVVIILEGTGAVNSLLPIIVTTVCAKWVGDQLNHGLYHTALANKRVPFIEASSHRRWELLTAADVMARPVVALDLSQSVGGLLRALATNNHHGFPVVIPNSAADTALRESTVSFEGAAAGGGGGGGGGSGSEGGSFVGIVLRDHLYALLACQPTVDTSLLAASGPAAGGHKAEIAATAAEPAAEPAVTVTEMEADEAAMAEAVRLRLSLVSPLPSWLRQCALRDLGDADNDADVCRHVLRRPAAPDVSGGARSVGPQTAPLPFAAVHRPFTAFHRPFTAFHRPFTAFHWAFTAGSIHSNTCRPWRSVRVGPPAERRAGVGPRPDAAERRQRPAAGRRRRRRRAGGSGRRRRR